MNLLPFGRDYALVGLLLQATEAHAFRSAGERTGRNFRTIRRSALFAVIGEERENQTPGGGGYKIEVQIHAASRFRLADFVGEGLGTRVAATWAA